MKKRMLQLLLAVTLVCVLTACGGEGKNPSNDKKPSQSKGEEVSRPGSEGGSQNAGSGNDAEKPKLVEERLYVDEENHSWNYYVQIYDNGGWEVSQQTGNLESYISYSYEKEKAGTYSAVQEYNHATVPPEYSFGGNVRLVMTDSELKLFYEDQEGPEVFIRYSLDEPLY